MNQAPEFLSKTYAWLPAKPTSICFRMPGVWLLIIATTICGGVYGDLWEYRTNIEFEPRQAQAAQAEKPANVEQAPSDRAAITGTGAMVGAAMGFLAAVSCIALVDVVLTFRQMRRSLSEVRTKLHALTPHHA